MRACRAENAGRAALAFVRFVGEDRGRVSVKRKPDRSLKECPNRSVCGSKDHGTPGLSRDLSGFSDKLQLFLGWENCIVITA
jgi:hypothetical protein